MIEISKDLKLPLEAVTQTFAILAKRGVGKTYTGAVMVEEMLKANLHVIVIDPIGVWWGLRAAANGRDPGLSIIIAGGSHADIPLTPTSGELMAGLVVDNRLSIVIDLSLFRKGEQVRFMADFAETLYRKNREAVHLMIDEADAFAPQRPMPGEQRMLGAIEDLVRRGRARGIGVTMITQRPAVLNKNVLTQIEVLVALRLTAPLDQKAVDEWVKTHAEEDQRDKFMTSLPSLPVGTAWFWSPGWLNIFQRVAVRKRETLDSSSTPKVGQKIKDPQKLAAIDLDSIRDQIQATIEKVEADDPKALRRRIAELENQFKNQKPDVQITQVEVLPKGFTDRLLKLVNQGSALYAAITELHQECKQFASASDTDSQFNKRSFAPALANKTTEVKKAPKIAEMQMNDSDGSKLSPGETKILIAAGQFQSGITRSHLTILTGYKRSSRNTYISRLLQRGLIETNGELVTITEQGVTELGNDYDPLPTGSELRDRLFRELPPGEKSILQVLVEAYPRTVSRDQISESTGYQRSSRNTYLSRMVAREIVDVTGQEVRASDSLF